MAYDASKLATIQTVKDVATRIKKEYTAAIGKSGHASFKKVDEIPNPGEAAENILYLVKDADTGNFGIHALIGGEMVVLGDTDVDLDGYVKVEDLEGLGKGSVYSAIKDDPDKADGDVIAAYFEGEDTEQPCAGDVFIVHTSSGDDSYEISSYIFDGENWVAITGNVDADKVIMRQNITMAGDYTQVGNKTKAQNGTAEFQTSGKSVASILTDIFSKRLQPTITAQPSVSGFTLTGAKAVEAGTKLTSVSLTAATLNAGSYQYGPDTGVTATNWKVDRVTSAGTETISTVDGTSLSASTDDNGGAGFVIGDAGGDSAVSSLKYKVTASYGAGVTAKDNLGDDSDPVISIAAGQKTKETSAYTPYRNYFYGATAEKPDIDSACIRALTKSGKAYASGTITIQIPSGAQRVVVACISSKTGVTKVINETAMNADVTSTFSKSTVEVEGADGYTAVSYNVWVFEPAVPYENAATLKVTLG